MEHQWQGITYWSKYLSYTSPTWVGQSKGDIPSYFSLAGYQFLNVVISKSDQAITHSSLLSSTAALFFIANISCPEWSGGTAWAIWHNCPQIFHIKSSPKQQSFYRPFRIFEQRKIRWSCLRPGLVLYCCWIGLRPEFLGVVPRGGKCPRQQDWAVRAPTSQESGIQGSVMKRGK